MVPDTPLVMDHVWTTINLTLPLPQFGPIATQLRSTSLGCRARDAVGAEWRRGELELGAGACGA